jgi:hypothetical protein
VNTMTINLAKALKVKNRLAGRVAKLTQDVQTYNCTQEGADRLDVPALYEERQAVVARLTDLKLAVSTANAPVQRTIYELAELKALVALLNGLNTQHGQVVEGYPVAGAVTYVAQLRKADVDREVRRCEAEIDRLQDRLDAFNQATTVSVDEATLAAADARG